MAILGIEFVQNEASLKCYVSYKQVQTLGFLWAAVSAMGPLLRLRLVASVSPNRRPRRWAPQRGDYGTMDLML